MNYIFQIFISLLLIFIIIHLCKKKNFLLNASGDKHQKFLSYYNIPLAGGLVLFLLSSTFINIKKFEIYFFFILMFLIGLFSDLKIITSTFIRFILQSIIIFVIIYLSNIFVDNTDIIYLDFLLNNIFFKYIFTLFCILIIVNGSNFIDGINTLNLGYFIIIILNLTFLNNENLILSQVLDLYNLLIIMILLYGFNFFNKLYLGDSGAYFIGLIFSIFLIDFYNQNENLSSIYIVNLLWYPAFENLFSIIRKIKFSKSPVKPDTNHFHHLLYQFFKKLKLPNDKKNTLTGLTINFYNIFCITVASNFKFNTQVQIMIILLNIFVYIIIYSKFFSKYKKY